MKYKVQTKVGDLRLPSNDISGIQSHSRTGTHLHFHGLCVQSFLITVRPSETDKPINRYESKDASHLKLIKFLPSNI
ncbi:hypothetical protein L1887_33332 [Cichorium endivia]|nr:hypothetical protein L1887_33332 [Cichorium endivia]